MDYGLKMRDLISKINNLKKTSVKKIIDEKLRIFEGFNKSDKKSVFSELCFCILTANYRADASIKIQSVLKDKFLSLPQKELEEKLRLLGHRFPRKRAEYIVEARKELDELMIVLNRMNEFYIRDWLVKNIKGIGYKEASHFLRNIGFENVAIIDFHIIDILVRNKIIERPKTLTKKVYLEIEKVLESIAKKTKLSLGELDLYLWFLETNKVMK